jgi:RNA polymerase primary sigma factor
MNSARLHGSRGGDGVADYLHLIRRIPLLTPAEELHLGGIVQEWLAHPSPAKALSRAGARARNRMVTANLRLVAEICRRYRGQAGNLGLIRAVERFDPSRGYKFSTYAFWWIRQSVTHYISECGGGIRIPMPMLTLAFRAGLLQASSEQPLSTRAMADQLGKEERQLEKTLRVVRQCRTTSLDQPAGGMSEGTSLIDLIRDDHTLSPQDDYQWLHEQLSSLDAREKQLLRLRYGEDEHPSYTEAARIMGLTKSNVQSLERRALRKLRHRLTSVLNPRSA